MNYPSELKYSKDHEWLKVDGENAIVGITHHAQDQLGDVVYVEMPDVGKTLERNDVFGVVESVKAVVDCYMPVSGEIIAINDELETTAELVNSDPHGDGWMIKFRMTNPGELDSLMSKAQYESYLAETAE